MRTLVRPLVFVAALACLLPSAASAADPPGKVLASILAAARAEPSVHSEGVGDYANSRVSFVSDAGLGQGIQRITYREGTRTGHVTIIVSANAAYVRGDAFTLLNYLNFRAVLARNYSGQWVRFPRGDRNYAAVAAGVTLSSLVDGLAPKGRLTSLPGIKIDGRKVLAVTGLALSTSGGIVTTVHARATGSPLPVRHVRAQGANDVTVTTFSEWGERVTVAAPKESVAISVIRKAYPEPVP